MAGRAADRSRSNIGGVVAGRGAACSYLD